MSLQMAMLAVSEYGRDSTHDTTAFNEDSLADRGVSRSLRVLLSLERDGVRSFRVRQGFAGTSDLQLHEVAISVENPTIGFAY